MEILHFQSFLESNKTTETFDTIEGEIFNLETNDSCDPKELLEIFKQYEEYQKKTENGIHGKTTQY